MNAGKFSRQYTCRRGGASRAAGDHRTRCHTRPARGGKLTPATGSNGIPVAQTAITTLLMMSRGLPHWLDAQRRKSWEPLRASAQPPDLQGQTIVIVGMGTIGSAVARFAQVLGMHVI